MKLINKTSITQLVGFLAVSLFVLPVSFAQEFQGLTNSCKDCHSSGLEEDSESKGFITKFEFVVWEQLDPHKKAYDSLESKLGKQMGELLGGVDVTKEKSCLACHTSLHNGELPQGDLAKEISLGISCEECHGPSKGWDLEHRKTSWREKTSEQKAEFGMVDMRNSTVRAKKCASCHVGSVKDNRVITHEMYVAGHPQLPSFNPESYMEAMPPHWIPMKEKIANIDGLEKTLEDAGLPTSEGKKLVSKMNAEIESLKQFLTLVGSQAQPVGEDKTFTHQFPELSLFDCAACHHDLRFPGWRQTRALPTEIGRPLFMNWPSRSTDLALVALDHNKESIAKQELNLLKALQGKPFGDLEKTKEQTSSYIALLEDLQADATSNLSSKDPEAIAGIRKSALKLLIKNAANEKHDYQSAAYTVRTIVTLINAMEIPDAENTIHKKLGKIRQYLWNVNPDSVVKYNIPIPASASRVKRVIFEELNKELEKHSYNQMFRINAFEAGIPEDDRSISYSKAVAEAAANYDPIEFSKLIQEELSAWADSL